MKVYTKTGDKGTTSLIGGKRVPKYDIRIEAYGTVDELMSYLGLLGDYKKVDKHTRSSLIEIQERLMTCASILATDSQSVDAGLPDLHTTDIVFLEKEMDEMDKKLPSLESFILPGGHSIVSHTHVARCICRRAERMAIQVEMEHKGSAMVVKYLNRLSDYLFVLARKFSKDFNAKEILWKPRL